MSPKLESSPSLKRNVAICYIRLSYTRNKDDTNSPERQKANIETICRLRSWTIEWYTDTVGHHSGRYENNRPGWLAAKARLGDPDVAALVANDFSRVHRKLARMSDLLDAADELGFRLIQAAPGRDFDTSTPSGRMMAQFIALQDESYAIDVSLRQKDNARFVNEQGKVNGITPFGTLRNDEGYLKRDIRGVWCLSNGEVVEGEHAVQPQPDARWRPYYRCALRILILYTGNRNGYEKIAQRMNQDGWFFHDRWHKPLPVTEDDVRRVLSNWPEYGGAVTQKRGKDKQGKNRAPYRYGLDEVNFYPQRAVFPLKLLIKVAQVRLARTVRKPDHGIISKARAYPLNEITVCAHCARRAVEQNNPKLRTRLSGNNQGMLRYRHKATVNCGCNNRSVPCSVYEADFGRLLSLLTVNAEGLRLMQEWAIQAERANAPGEAEDLEQQKQEAIALCKRRIDAAVHLYGDGRLDRGEYLRRVEQDERKIEHWEARTSDTEKAARELALCMNAFSKLALAWETATDDEKQSLVRGLFTEILYDLDTRRIVDFKLKPWAERYLMLRASLYEDAENGSMEPKNRTVPAVKGMEQDVPSRGFEPRFWP